MFTNTRSGLLFCFIFIIYIPMQAMVYDNRYFPLYGRSYTRTLCKQSSFFTDVMIMSARDASLDADKTVPLPEIFGTFDQRSLAQAIVAVDGTKNSGAIKDIINSSEELPWKIKGKIQAEGLAFAWNQHVYKYFSCGMSWFVMHVMSRHLFKPAGNTAMLDIGLIESLDATRREMLECIGITSTKWSKSGMSDIDCYFRVGNVWDYPYKCRRIDAGVRLGVLIPSGVQREIDNPASIPFGGDGHWGMYVSGDAEFEVREDWSLGLLLRVSKRFTKTKTHRLQVAQLRKEHLLYGAIVGQAEREEGVSYVFAPYVRLEDLREGLGLLVGYTIAGHDNDCFTDQRVAKTSLSSIGDLNKTSDWIQEYMTFNLYYDFAKVRISDSLKPTVSFKWDLPVQYFAADKVPKTHRVSLGIEFDF